MTTSQPLCVLGLGNVSQCLLRNADDFPRILSDGEGLQGTLLGSEPYRRVAEQKAINLINEPAGFRVWLVRLVEFLELGNSRHGAVRQIFGPFRRRQL